MSKLYQLFCNHDALAIIETKYNSSTVTSTAVDHKIKCIRCGKTIVPKEIFDDLKMLLTED